MLGILLIYWVGKAFYELANQHGKSSWGFAVLGVVSYYGGIILAGVLTGIIVELASPGLIDDTNDTLLGLFMLPFGVLSCWGTYVILKKSWSKQKEVSSDALDGGLLNTDTTRYTQNER